MQVNITARHCEISATFRGRIIEEAQELHKIFDRIESADVIVANDAGIHKAEVTIRLAQHVMNAKAEGVTIRQAYGAALEKAERQIRKFKGKLVGRRSPKEPNVVA